MKGSGLISGGNPATNPFGGVPVVVDTVLNIKEDALNYWNNMTAFFDKNWTPEPDRITLPFCFFHVTKYSETRKAETSTKRVIMYRPPEAEDNEEPALQIERGLMQTIADNVVVQPKEYRLEVVVPFLPFGRYVRQGIEMARVFSSVLTMLQGNPNRNSQENALSPGAVAWIQAELRDVFGSSGAVQNAATAMGDHDGIMSDSLDGMMSGSSMVNKNSLDVMFERGTIIQFKTWMGFDYKYAVITDCSLEKRGVEDDVWRGDITLREIPVLSLAPVTGIMNTVDRSWTIHAVNKFGAMLGHRRASTQMPFYQVLMGDEEDDDGEADA